MKDAQTFRCPNVDPESDEFKYGMTGHRYRLEQANADRETWKCVRCGQVKIEPAPFKKNKRIK